MTRSSRPSGLGAIEVIVVLAILAAAFLMVLMAAPRGRERARLAGCQKNLMEIGVALAIYDESEAHLPTVELAAGPGAAGDGPLKVLMAALGVADLRAAAGSRGRGAGGKGFVPGERRVAGFLCPCDPDATAGGGPGPAPVSYRATTGGSIDGRDGAFAPGRRIGLAAIEAADGRSFTAAFAERLVGDGRPAPAPQNYALAAGPLAASGCPAGWPGTAWKGDAGASWVAADWRSTLYNHALTPNASPSCIAADGLSAFMGASSGHVAGVNLLACDGSVRTITPRIDPGVWRAWAAIDRPTESSSGPSP